ncbi:hypothetical protein [Microlunatus sp. GCM10028923]|uniref:hypothetical protein n=1 Tax=Microlunatus sp. GCM10028923 TaxID=3273400 RepID=UPI0036079CF9
MDSAGPDRGQRRALRIALIILVPIIVLAGLSLFTFGVDDLRLLQVRGLSGVAGADDRDRLIRLEPDVTTGQARAAYDRALGLPEGWSLSLGLARLPVSRADRDHQRATGMSPPIDALLAYGALDDPRIEEIMISGERTAEFRTGAEPIALLRDLLPVITTEGRSRSLIDSLTLPGTVTVTLAAAALAEADRTDAFLAAAADLPALRSIALGDRAEVVLVANSEAELAATCRAAARTLSAHRVRAELRIELARGNLDSAARSC